ncbi:zona pellucida sperm-binding protein 3-like [Polyodon spathula]|uniref:zona pellucida sperm-binding protein 3-like n=1 Tax=Polyodon spathula TaxID=7913 RepID=UPI001B7D9177|nr:zona pellucida sperm-binding protein 3-like [Polyodon spathula]
MVSLWKCVVLALCCVPFAAPQEGVGIACFVDSVTVRVLLDYFRPALPLDPSGLLLGTCPPSSRVDNNMVFQYGLLDCLFMRMVTANLTSYMNVLTYKPTQGGFYQTPFNRAIVCTYTRPAGWAPPVYNPALGDASGFGKLEFTMGIMNDDFSAPRTSSLFFLGSPINIAAAVKQQFHMPLMVYMEACVAASTPELSPSSQTYPLITNHGCFVDGQTGNSRFLPRVQTSEIRLVVQAFKFTQRNTDVYIHCRLLAWDPAQLGDPTKKACSFNQRTRSWELLDNPGRSSVCSCCTSNCSLRKRRDTAEEGLRHTAVLGPLRILPEELSAGSQESYQRSPALSLEEPQPALAWLAAPLLLMALLGALSLGYYVWRCPRLCSKSSSEFLIPVPIDEMHTVGTVSSSLPARLVVMAYSTLGSPDRAWKHPDKPVLQEEPIGRCQVHRGVAMSPASFRISRCLTSRWKMKRCKRWDYKN